MIGPYRPNVPVFPKADIGGRFAGIRSPRRGGKADGKEKKTTEEQPKAKEQKTKRELQAMARERLGCAVPVRRNADGGWYFRIIEFTGLNSGALHRRANCSPRSCASSMTSREIRRGNSKAGGRSSHAHTGRRPNLARLGAHNVTGRPSHLTNASSKARPSDPAASVTRRRRPWPGH